MKYIKNANIFDGEKFIDNQILLINENEPIKILNQYDEKISNFQIDGSGYYVIPGFIDVQVNGGGGAFFNDDISEECINKIISSHLSYGTTSIFPTLITDKKEKLSAALSLAKILQQKKLKAFLGIHLEGPFINPNKNGIHSKNYIRNLEGDEIELLKKNNSFKIILTCAPECVDLNKLEELKKLNSNLSFFSGHTNANYMKMTEAFQKCFIGVTHLFNACSQWTSREVGVVGSFFLDSSSYAGIIVDGFHLSYESLKIALKIKSFKKYFLVSDAMPPSASEMTHFYIHSKEIFVKDGKCVDKDGTLAGSSLTLYQAFKNVVENKIVSLEEAVQMSSTNIAECLNLNKAGKFGFAKGKIAENYDADILLLKKQSLELDYIFRNGRLVYKRNN